MRHSEYSIFIDALTHDSYSHSCHSAHLLLPTSITFVKSNWL